MTFSYCIKQLFLLVVVGVTPSCIKYHEMVKSEFPQGQDAADVREITQTYVRSATVYDQFTTLAVFDALWLSPEVMATYADMYGKRRGKNDAACKAMLSQEDTKIGSLNAAEFTSFYVLADLRVKTHKGLHEKGSFWTLALENATGKRVEAALIKNVELDPEYQMMFGYRFNLFKEIYLVKFPAHVEGKPVFAPGEPLTLLLSSPRKNMRISWNVPIDPSKKQKKLLKNYDTCDWF